MILISIVAFFTSFASLQLQASDPSINREDKIKTNINSLIVQQEKKIHEREIKIKEINELLKQYNVKDEKELEKKIVQSPNPSNLSQDEIQSILAKINPWRCVHEFANNLSYDKIKELQSILEKSSNIEKEFIKFEETYSLRHLMMY